MFFLISPAFRGELLVFLVSYDNSLFSWRSPAFRKALLVFPVFFSHRQNSANPPDWSEAFLLRQIVRPGAFNAVPDPHVMMIFVNDYEIFSKEAREGDTEKIPSKKGLSEPFDVTLKS